MKLFILLLTLISTSSAIAQKSTPSSAETSSRVLNFNVGMTSSAPNFGVRLDSSRSMGSLGGYFFLQTEKTDANVGQVMSFGGHSYFRLIDTSNASAYLAPGAGLAMVKGANSDTSVVGPSLRIGTQFKLAGGGAIGLERLEFWNWFDSKTASSVSYTSAVYSMSFR